MRTDGPAPAERGAPLALLWAMLAAALALLYVSWTYPLVTVTVSAELAGALIPPSLARFTILDETRSVVTMIERLVETNYLLIAGLIIFFGMVLPVAKNIGIALLLASRPGSRSRRTAAALQFIGRFAMVDIFAVSIIVSVMAAGTIGQGDNPGPATVSTVTELRTGFYIFVAYVLLSFAMDIALAMRFRKPGA